LVDELEGELADEQDVEGVEDEFGEGFDAGDGSEEGQADEGDASEAVTECDDEVELPMEATQLETAAEIDLSELAISAAQARRMAPILCSNRHLTTIKCDGHDLSTSDLKDEDELEWDSEEFHDVEAIIIAEFLKRNTALKRLDLARNSISDSGACALALALRENSTLEYLNLESNVVAEKGGKALSEAVQANSTLQYLNVMYNAIPSSGQQELRDLWTKAHQGSQLGLHL